MEEILNFMIQLGKLFSNVVQKPGVVDQKAIALTAKLFLKDKKISLAQIKDVISQKEYIDRFENLNDILELLVYLEWQEKHSK